MPTAKGYWRWRIQQRGEFTFRAQYRSWWWPFWASINIQGWGYKSYTTAADAVAAVKEELRYKEKARIFRQTPWEVVEEGRYPE